MLHRAALTRLVLFGALGVTMGCEGCRGSIDLGQGAAADARLTADMYTWECQEAIDTSTFKQYAGVYAFDISLEYAPDGLKSRELPAAGQCEEGLSMFPFDAGDQGADIPGVDNPRWATTDMGGELRRQSAGFYYDQAINNQHSCGSTDDMMGDGLVLSEAGVFSDVDSALAGSIEGVEVDIDDDNDNGVLDFGETVDLEWDADGWDEAWIQVRQEREGEAWGTVTCNVSGDEAFSVDSEVWDLLNGNLNVEVINLYVGLQNSDTIEVEDGQKIEVVTRAMHVMVVQEASD